MKNKFRLLAAIIAAVISINSFAFAETAPSIEANSAILIESTTGKVLFEKNANKAMYPASMTKLLTAIVVFEYFKPDDIIVVGREINDISLDSSKAGHKINESITVENLVRGLIIPSGNDSAAVIASAVAKKYKNDDTLIPEECEKIFSELMNEKAKTIGCTNTNFVNPHGYHDDNHYTTAEDMAKISAIALENETLKEICGEKRFSGNSMGNKDKTGLVTNDYNWSSHNLLITAGEYSYPYATGLKTGFTNQAGNCVAASAEKEGVQLIAVIFDSPDPNRWIDAQKLFDFGFDNFGFMRLIWKGDVAEEIQLYNHKSSEGDSLNLIVKNDIDLFASNDDFRTIVKAINITNEDYIYKSKDNTEIKIKAPIEADTELGTVIYKLGDKVLAEEKLYAERSVEKANLIEKIMYNLKTFFTGLFTTKGLITTSVAVVVLIILIIIIRILINRTRRPKNKYIFKTSKRRRY